MEVKKILIVEDDMIVAHSIKSMLERNGYHVTSISVSKQEAFDSIKVSLPDLVLMDIAIEGPIDGISTARSIKRAYDIPVIFITQIEDEDVFKSAKEIFPHNYITKPFTDEQLRRSVELALLNNNSQKGSHTHQHDSAFILSSDNQYKKLTVNNILCIEANGSYSKIHYMEQQKHLVFMVSISSNNVARQLASSTIMQVHKSYYINLDQIDYIHESSVYLEGFKDPIPIGRSFKEKLYELLNILKSGSSQKK